MHLQLKMAYLFDINSQNRRRFREERFVPANVVTDVHVKIGLPLIRFVCEAQERYGNVPHQMIYIGAQVTEQLLRFVAMTMQIMPLQWTLICREKVTDVNLVRSLQALRVRPAVDESDVRLRLVMVNRVEWRIPGDAFIKSKDVEARNNFRRENWHRSIKNYRELNPVAGLIAYEAPFPGLSKQSLSMSVVEPHEMWYVPYAHPMNNETRFVYWGPIDDRPPMKLDLVAYDEICGYHNVFVRPKVLFDQQYEMDVWSLPAMQKISTPEILARMIRGDATGRFVSA